MNFRRGAVIVLSLGLGAAAPVLTPGVAMGDGGTAKEIHANHLAPARDTVPQKDTVPEKDTNPCADSSTVRLKVLVNDDGRLEVTGIVWSDDNDVWDWKFRHNDDVSADGDVKAKDADKSFKIVRTMYNFIGPDSVLFRADNSDTGETCKVTVNY
jgi:hypothetical protein